MKSTPLEVRIAALEAEVARLKQHMETKGKEDWLHANWGKFANDPLYDEAMRLGREYRESLRPKSKKRTKRMT